MFTNRFSIPAPQREKLLNAIRAGGYPHIAAEAFGVPKRVFDNWLKRGNLDNAREPYCSLAKDVREAFAVARLLAETAIYKDEPKTWLLHGPGREADDRAGWSVSVKAAEVIVEQRNFLREPEFLRAFNKILDALGPFPEARQQVAQALTTQGMNEQKETDHGETSV